MAKKNFSLLLNCVFSLTFAYAVFPIETKCAEPDPQRMDACFAPAPDSFRITSIGSNFISLAWHPTVIGATHRVIVFNRNEVNEWIPIKTFNNVQGTTFLISNLDLNLEHKVSISTNCSFNDPSELTSSLDGINLIIDLSLAGRIPINPLPVSCDNIPINSNWKGFRVTYNTQGITMANLFELIPVENNGTNNNVLSHIEIGRVFTSNPIVAVDKLGYWPNNNLPKIENIGHPFRIDRLIGGGPNKEIIGQVDFSSSSSSFSLCPDPQYSWGIDYTFTPLIAHSAIEYIVPQTNDFSRYSNFISDTEIKVQNPFREYLNVFVPKDYSKSSMITFMLSDCSGRMFLKQQFEAPISQISFPVKNIPSGIYTLSIESERNIKNLKVVKIE